MMESPPERERLSLSPRSGGNPNVSPASPSPSPSPRPAQSSKRRKSSIMFAAGLQFGREHAAKKEKELDVLYSTSEDKSVGAVLHVLPPPSVETGVSSFKFMPEGFLQAGMQAIDTDPGKPTRRETVERDSIAYLDSLISKVSQKFSDLMPPPSPPMLGSGDDDDGVDAAEDSGVGADIGNAASRSGSARAGSARAAQNPDSKNNSGHSISSSFHKTSKAFRAHAKKKKALQLWSEEGAAQSESARALLSASAARRSASRNVITAHAASPADVPKPWHGDTRRPNANASPGQQQRESTRSIRKERELTPPAPRVSSSTKHAAERAATPLSQPPALGSFAEEGDDEGGEGREDEEGGNGEDEGGLKATRATQRPQVKGNASRSPYFGNTSLNKRRIQTSSPLTNSGSGGGTGGGGNRGLQSRLSEPARINSTYATSTPPRAMQRALSLDAAAAADAPSPLRRERHASKIEEYGYNYGADGAHNNRDGSGTASPRTVQQVAMTDRNTKANARLYKAASTLAGYNVVVWKPPPASFWTTPSEASLEGQQTAAERRAQSRMTSKNKVERLRDGVHYWPPTPDEQLRPRSPTKILMARRNAPGALQMSMSHVAVIKQQKVSDRNVNAEKMPILSRSRRPAKLHYGIPNSRLYHDGVSPEIRAKRAAEAATVAAATTGVVSEKKAHRGSVTDKVSDGDGDGDGVASERGGEDEPGGFNDSSNVASDATAESSLSLPLPAITTTASAGSKSGRRSQRCHQRPHSREGKETALTRAKREHALWLTTEMAWIKSLPLPLSL